MALAAARSTGNLEVTALLCTVNADAQRVQCMPSVEVCSRRRRIVSACPRHRRYPAACSNERYETLMAGALEVAGAAGVTCVVFGDLFLQDVREYREAQLAGPGPARVPALEPADGRSRAGDAQLGFGSDSHLCGPGAPPRRFRGEELRREAVERAPHRGRSLR